MRDDPNPHKWAQNIGAPRFRPSTSANTMPNSEDIEAAESQLRQTVEAFCDHPAMQEVMFPLLEEKTAEILALWQGQTLVEESASDRLTKIQHSIYDQWLPKSEYERANLMFQELEEAGIAPGVPLQEEMREIAEDIIHQHIGTRRYMVTAIQDTFRDDIPDFPVPKRLQLDFGWKLETLIPYLPENERTGGSPAEAPASTQTMKPDRFNDLRLFALRDQLKKASAITEPNTPEREAVHETVAGIEVGSPTAQALDAILTAADETGLVDAINAVEAAKQEQAPAISHR